MEGIDLPTMNVVFLLVAIIVATTSYQRIMNGPEVLRLILIALLFEVLHNTAAIIEVYTNLRLMSVLQ